MFSSRISTVLTGCRIAAIISVFGALGSATGWAQTSIGSFGVGKKLDYLQSSSALPTSSTLMSDPGGPFHFSADLDGGNLHLLSPAPKITLPNSTQYTLAGSSTLMGIAASYANKAALDAAFPNGSYSFTAGASTLPVSLGAGDTYPTEIPQITNGTWDGQGRLVISAANGATLNFNSFSNYASGVGGIISFNLYAVSGTALGTELVGMESVALGGYASDPALTAYSIPAGFLQPDRTYFAELSFARIVDLNTSFLPAVGSGTFLRTTGLMISTAAPAAAPIFTTQPASQTVTVGANVILSVTASGNPTPVFQWRKNGVDIGGATLVSFTLTNVQLSDAGSYTVAASNSAGITTSETAVLTVNPVPVAPTITLQPASQTVAAGNPVSFIAVASGTPTPTYQWKKGGVDIGGATSSTYTIASASAGDAGSYTVVATNSVSSVTSDPATLTVSVVGTAPVITTQPESQTVIAGNAVTFTAAASGAPVPTFQWQKNGVDIPGATSASYTIPSAVGEDEASYAVVATNVVDAVTSNAALLSVIVAPSNAVISFSIE